MQIDRAGNMLALESQDTQRHHQPEIVTAIDLSLEFISADLVHRFS